METGVVVPWNPVKIYGTGGLYGLLPAYHTYYFFPAVANWANGRTGRPAATTRVAPIRKGRSMFGPPEYPPKHFAHGSARVFGPHEYVSYIRIVPYYTIPNPYPGFGLVRSGAGFKVWGLFCFVLFCFSRRLRSRFAENDRLV